MANEIFIARQDTLENVQSTVNEIDANVDTANSTLGNFAGGGTDSVVTELNALKQAVAALTTKTDGLQTDVTNIKTDVGTIETTVEQIAGQGGESGGVKLIGIKANHSSSSETTLINSTSDKKRIVRAYWEIRGSRDDAYTVKIIANGATYEYAGYGGDVNDKLFAVEANKAFKVTGHYTNSKYAGTLSDLCVYSIE